jgi:DNA-binding NarL/FixJ family response regulator
VPPSETPEQGRAHDADLLKLSEKTVEFHKRHITEAFHLESNAALVIFALKEGLISLKP